MRNSLPVLILSAVVAMTATGAYAQLQMQEQSVGAPRRGPTVYRPQSIEPGPTAGAARPAPPTARPNAPTQEAPVMPAAPRR